MTCDNSTVASIADCTLGDSAMKSAGTSTQAPSSRPPVALVVSPSRLSLAGAGRAVVRITNTGARPVVVDVTRSGFALDLRGRPKIVGAVGPRTATRWLTSRPRSVAIRPGASGAVTVASRLPARAEPGDHQPVDRARLRNVEAKSSTRGGGCHEQNEEGAHAVIAEPLPQLRHEQRRQATGVPEKSLIVFSRVRL